MTKINDIIFLEHIIDAIQQIEEYIYEISYEIFCQNRMINDAVQKELENIGEACRNLTDDFREKHSNIPWSEIIGMRNKISHQYFSVDLRTVWDTIKNDLPLLKVWVNVILEKGE